MRVRGKAAGQQPIPAHLAIGGQSQTPPPGWTSSLIRSLIEHGTLWAKNGYADGRHNENRVGIAHLRPFNVTDDGRIDLSQVKSVSPPALQCPQRLIIGDVIFNNTNSEDLVGKTALFGLCGDFVLSNHMTVVRVLQRGRIHADWLARALHWKWLKGEFRALCRRHVNQASISLDRLGSVELWIAPLPEQRAIAATLRAVQRAKEACERVIGATRQLKQSLLAYLFTYGPVPFDQADQVPLKETEFGPIPEHWEVVTLSDLSTRVQYGTSTRCDADVTGYPVLRIPNVVGGRVDTTDLKYLAASPADAERYVLHSGDLLFVRTNGVRENVGRCAVYQGKPDRALFASYLIRVLLSANRALPAFVQLLTETPSGRASFSERASGAADGKFNINSQTIRATPIPLPPLPDQLLIASHLSAVDAKLAAEEARRVALDNLFKSLLHHLMTGKVRVNHLVDQLAGQSAQPALHLSGEEAS